ncbi:MAG: FimB/Mfa2 family fimbrial subunit [Paraprevotella sp.]|nr:FimB/Mfa2 family fimbrial subunit [Paraprevotella sp.]
MKRHLSYIISLLAVFTLTFTACSEDTHEGEHGLAVALTWADEADKGTNIGDVKLWIYNTDGEAVGEYTYDEAAGLARQRFDLPEGDYLIVAATNLTAPFSVKEAATGATPYENLLFALDDASASPAHAHYGVTEVKVNGNTVQTATVSLRRVMSELSVTVEGAPSGSKLNATVTDAATGVLPAVKGTDDDTYGTATDEASAVSMPEVSEQDGVLTTSIRLMPTVTGHANSHLTFLLTQADGTTFTYNAEAPVMKPSGKYVVTLDYADLHPYIRITVNSINDWTEGWTISGEILNPDE